MLNSKTQKKLNSVSFQLRNTLLGGIASLCLTNVAFAQQGPMAVISPGGDITKRSTSPGEGIYLSGKDSTDDNGQPLTYSWSASPGVFLIPAHQNLDRNWARAAVPTTGQVTLTVTDLDGNSGSETIQLEFIAPEPMLSLIHI